MARVTLTNVRKTYPNGYVAVHDFNLDAADGEFVVFVGPSGCGKSTTLRMIAGLEDLTSGSISIGGRVVNDVHPKDRDIAMVFQNYALYPHMSVYDNMAFALKLRGMPKPEIDKRVRGAAQMLELGTLLDRKPKALSGGQRQRVAVGRAIVREPKAFLFDEPLSNLDAKLRITTRGELKSIHHRLKTTTIYVTHDQEEAMTLGDRIIVMAQGIIQQAAPPLQMYRRPANRFVASFVGTPPMNFLEGKIEREGSRLKFIEGSSDPEGQPYVIELPEAIAPKIEKLVGQPAVIGFRPQALSEARVPGGLGGQPTPEGASQLLVPITVVEPLGDVMDVFCSTPKHPRLVARIAARDGLTPGTRLALVLDPAGLHVFEPGDFGLCLTSA